MRLNTCKGRRQTPSVLVAPAFPFSGPEIFQDLKRRLAVACSQPISYERLARCMGVSVSTAFTWCEFFRHPHVVGFLALLERLCPTERVQFLNRYLRTIPTFEHSNLACSPATIAKLQGIIRKKVGATFIVGPPEARNILFQAIGHHYCRIEKHQLPAGIDLHVPAGWVPVESLLYLDETTAFKILRQDVLANLPRVLNRRSKLLLFNGVLSAVPEARTDMLKCARRKHVIVAEEFMPELKEVRRQLSGPIHVLTLLPSKCHFGQFRVHFRFVNPRKLQQKRNYYNKVHSPR